MLSTLYRFRVILLCLTLVFCGFLWPSVQKAVKVNNSLTIWFLETDPSLKEYNRFHDKFGNDELLIFLVKDEETLLSKKYFTSFLEITKAIELMPEVRLIIGPGSTTILTKGFGIISRPLLSKESEADEVRSDLENSHVLSEQLFNKDYTAARFIVVFKKDKNFDSKRGDIINNVKQTIYRHLKKEQTFFGGVGVIYEGLNTLSRTDFGFFLGAGYLAMFVLLLCIYRKIIILVYAVSTILLSTYITLGIYGLMGQQLNLMTILIPSILIVLGIMDIMHVLNEHSQLSANESVTKKEAAFSALNNVFRPCLFTTLTTMAGFLSLLISPMAILRQFGLYAAIGIFLCLLFTYFLGLIFLPLSVPSQATIFSSRRLVNRLFESVLRYKRIYTGVSVALILLSVAGIFFIKSDTYTLGYFPQENQVVKDHKMIEKLWGPYMPLEFTVTPSHGKQLSDPEIIKRSVAFADSAKKLSGIASSFGFQSFYQAGLQTQYGEKSNRMYNSKAALSAVHKILPLYYPKLYSGFAHENSQTGRITLFGQMSSANELALKMDSLLSLSKRLYGSSAKVTASGYQPMYANIVNYITQSQVNSLFLSMILIFILIYLFIRHLKLTALAVISNLIPVVVMLGAMGFAGIYLDTASASIAAIVLSICVDDTIHFIYYYKKLRKDGELPINAQRATINHIGSSIVLASLVLITGYALMIFGSLKTVQLFGLLTVIALVAALYSELVIFPLLLAKFDRKKIL